MAWMSTEAARIAGRTMFDTLTRADLPPVLGPVAERGWMVVDDAVLLRAWYESYFGERSTFSETLDYEIAVNGRGIPDLDLTYEGEARAAALLRRGAAFAWAALHQANREMPSTRLAAYVSVAPILMDPHRFTGNVTFCALRPGQPAYIDPVHATDDVVLAAFSEDCTKPLPSTGRCTASRWRTTRAAWSTPAR